MLILAELKNLLTSNSNKAGGTDASVNVVPETL